MNFGSDVDLYSRFSESTYTCFVPDFLASPQESDTAHKLLYRNSREGHLRFGETIVEVSFPWRQMRDGETLLYLGYPLIELQRQHHSSLTAHAACVEINGVAVLLLGKEGAGKTSIALELCQRHNASLIANDLTVIGNEGGNLVAIGGTKFFFLRYESIRRSQPHLLRLFTEPTTDPWLHKTKVLPVDLGISVQLDPRPISQAFMVHVDEKQRDIYAGTADNLVTKLYLNENFSRYIRSTCTMMLGDDNYDLMGYIPPLDSEALFMMRRGIITMLLDQANLRYVSGDSKSLADHVANSTERP